MLRTSNKSKMATYKTFRSTATKLGLGEEEKVLSKAAELERILQTKTIAGNNMTDMSKTVIFLDLAAAMCGMGIDTKTAIKYSGLKNQAYINTRKIVENLLELNCDKLTCSALCLTLQCGGVQKLAEQILEEYQKQAKMDVDLTLPQYVCMAVYHACRINKNKLSKSKIIEKSRLKPAQWNKLDAEWSKFVDENFATLKKKKGRLPKYDEADENTKMEVNVRKDEETEPQIEPYEDWKRRMLETARKELKEEQHTDGNEHSMPPRRSPRKTPQKNIPFTSPTKTKGVRLLFPRDL